MNAKQFRKAFGMESRACGELLKEAGYAFDYDKWSWAKDGTCLFDGSGMTWALSTYNAYAKFIEAQEALEAQRTQAADDNAGEVAYNEVQRSYNEVKAEAETAHLRAENEALKAWKAGALADFHTIAHKAKRIHNGDLDMESAQALALGIYTVALQGTPAPTAQAASEVTLSDAEIDFLINNTGDTSEDYEDYTAPSYLIPDALYKKLEKLTDFTIFANHYRLAREYDTPANRAAIASRRAELAVQS